jgi:hypothetical protein
MTIKRLWLLCLLSILISGCKSDLQVSLDMARLCRIPRSATGIQTARFSNLFTSAFYLRFNAPAEDIERFIQCSPSLKTLTPTTFNSFRKHLPYPDHNDNREIDKQHMYFTSINEVPWFNPTVEVRGRKYEIPQDGDANWGSLIVDDEKNIVYIEVRHS